MVRKWSVVGSCRRKGDGLEIATVDGSTFAVRDVDAPALIVAGETVPLYQTSDFSEPFRCGEVSWSQSGQMLMISGPGSGRYGAMQVSGAHIRAHYLRGEKRAVEVVRPPEPGLPKGVKLAVV